MANTVIRKTVFAALISSTLMCGALLSAEEVAARHAEGLVHGFLVVSTLDGKPIASGDLSQTTEGDRVHSRLLYRFKDGSVDDDTAVFTQRHMFHLISDHHVQRGPSFPHPMDVSIDAATGQVTIRSMDNGKEKVTSDHIDLPTDLANGMILTILKNIRPDAAETKVSLLAATPKPRLVKLSITPHGEDPFSTAGSHRKATHYVVKVEIGGVAGVVAPLIGKQPQDTQVWILGGKAPAFVKSEGPFYQGGPAWRIELTSPVWPREPESAK